MPSRTLPSFTAAEVKAHNSAKSCYVTVGEIVYDVTDFLDAHPGGADLILDYGGKDITDILQDEASHKHSDAAYEVLDEAAVGYLRTGGDKAKQTSNGRTATNGKANGIETADQSSSSGSNNRNASTSNGDAQQTTPHPRTGMTCEEDLSKETDVLQDYKKHKFLDLSRPLLMQVWRGGFSKAFYLDQVHRPRHYKGGESAPLFGNFLEPLSKTPWWAIPLLWLPSVSYGVYLASAGFHSVAAQAALFGLGLGIWTLVEYILHRFLFHLDSYLPDNRMSITLHFLLHGVHHYLPMDKYRLVMPPTLFVVLATPFWKLAHSIFPDWSVGTTVFCGGIFGYICYDLTHYFLHHQNLPLWYKGLKKYHLAHHFLDYELGFGVTSRFWDRVFGTELPMRPVKVA